MTNKVASVLDLQTIEKYVKNTYNIELNHVEFPRLSQSKSFLKIIGIPYILEFTKICISIEEVEKIIKENHIFNNIILALRPRIIKVSPKSDILIIWIDIWDAQSGAKAKRLINRCFNVGRYIASICGANMNPEIPQYKNCWKWGHTTGTCRIQDVRCVKCSGPHQSIHHWQFTWCCKANKKTNPPRLKTKKEELYLHTSKCSNCKGNYQADSNECLF